MSIPIDYEGVEGPQTLFFLNFYFKLKKLTKFRLRTRCNVVKLTNSTILVRRVFPICPN